eukprot:1236669-Pyramimonas_sp.AAC.2
MCSRSYVQLEKLRREQEQELVAIKQAEAATNIQVGSVSSTTPEYGLSITRGTLTHYICGLLRSAITLD